MTFASYPHNSTTHLVSRFAVVLLLLLSLRPASADWPDGNHDKWVQFPDPSGFDILAAQPPAAESTLPLIIADDFQCRTPGYITNIHIWASWLNENTSANPGPIPPIPITLSIWSDVATNTSNPFSHPGIVLWHQTFFPGVFPGQYTVKVAGTTATETFLDPFPPPIGNPMGPDYTIYLYNFKPSDPLFFQTGTDTSPTNYWLAVSASTNTSNFGWKTTATNNWNDDAVWGHVQFDGYNALGDWLDLHDPRDPSKSLDMAFALTTGGTPPPPPPPVDKWHQLPDINGFDVNATAQNIVADDFWCTNASVITNILVWGSWQNDAAFDGTIFILSIWDNVASSPTTANTPFSRPGNRPIWTETFNPGDYTRTSAGKGNEHFYSPPSTVLTPEGNIYLYSFIPKHPFCQKGAAPPNAMTYWLSVQAIVPSGTAPFGWKTSTNHWRDDAVYGHTAPGPTVVFDWRDLHDPSVANGPSLDMAFRLIDGPPTPDCDPHNRPKFAQLPDITPNGLDVLATFPKVAGDDFPCKVTGPISGITIWGSWLNDQVDTNAVFQLGLWTDAPKDATFPFSRPGQLLCTNIFYPPQTVGTFVQRYKPPTVLSNLQENFFDPEAAYPPFKGTDTQIWRYDFYPFQPSCWIQRGGDATFAGGLTYWITLSYLSSGTANLNLFGWKTSTNHYQDDGVWGHMNPTFLPIGDWKDLHDPRSGISLDLAFALKNFPVTGKNEDVRNTTTSTATGLQVVLAGFHIVTQTYDDSPPWNPPQITYSAGNTIITWTGRSIPPNGTTHVGWEMGGSGPPAIVSQSWLGSGGVVIGPAYQLSYHYLGNAATGGAVLILNNNIVGLPLILNNGSIEFFLDPPRLDQMNPQVTGRNPLAKIPLALPTQPILPGGLMRIPMPPGVPNNAMYALFIMNLMDTQGQLQGMDFVLTPLDMALRPVIHGADLLPGSLNLRWFSLQDRIYHVQMRSDLNITNPVPWSPVSLPDLIGDGDELNATVPLGQGQSYYRVVLDPQ